MAKLVGFDVEKIRADFPILQREVRPGVRLVYLDSTATSQKPLQVIQAMDRFYTASNANIHRGIHTLAEEATALYEAGRERIAQFINAPSARQVIFTRNATESINLVAYTWGRANLRPGDVVVLTEMEHHSNLVPWQMLAAERDLRLEFIPVTSDGHLDLETYHGLLDLQPRLVSFTQMSNVLGTINPAAEIIRLAHQAGAITLVDGAQSVPHFAGRCPGPPGGLPGLFSAQNGWTNRNWRSIWSQGPLGEHAAFPGWRRHDQTGPSAFVCAE